MLVRFGINLLPDIHIVDRYFLAIRKLGVVNDGLGLDYYLSETEIIGKDKLPDGFRKGFIGFVIGGKHNTKIFPEGKVIEVCKKLKKPVVLLGGVEDFEIGDRIAQTLGKNIYNACGKYNINQSASLIQMSDLVITNDTGLMHIAAAFHKKIISVWGNTIPDFGMYPYLPGNESNSYIMEVSGLKCRPCSKLGYSGCPKNHFNCMQMINVEEIASLCKD